MSMACRMSSGARNWPFLRLTTRPVFAAATIRSVCRERNAGICRTSATSAACARLPRLVDVGEDRHADVAPDLRRGLPGRLRCPGPRNERQRRAVGFVERRLEDVGHAGPPGDGGDRAAEVERVVVAFDDARARRSGPGRAGRARRRRRYGLHDRRDTGSVTAVDYRTPASSPAPVADRRDVRGDALQRHAAACRPLRRTRQTADAGAAAST